MAFLYPWFLVGGALAIAIPIVIHLLNQRKVDRVVWAAMRFLKISADQNRRRMRLEDILLLLLRVCLVLLLGLILARPVMRGAQAAGWFGSSRVSAVILLDNSYSMCQSDGVTTTFDRAKRAALDCLDTFPGGSSVSVYLVSDLAEPLVGQPTYDLNLARQAIQNAPLCDRATNLLPGLERAVDQLSHTTTAGRREIYLITDGQASGFQQLDDITRLLNGARDLIETHVILAGAPETENLCVSDLRMDANIPVVGVPQAFFVDMTNDGQTTATGIRASIRIDDQDPCDDALIESIPPGQTRSVVLSATFRQSGYHTVTASIPHDHLPADDQRTAALRVLKGINVLLVDGQTGLAARDDETYYLRQALVPVPPPLVDSYFVQCTTVTPADLAAQKFADFDLVVLANVNDLDDAQTRSLGQFVRSGGGLMIFPGPNTDPVFFNQKLLMDQGILPASLGDLQGSGEADNFVTFQSKNLQHPIVSLWNDPANGDLSRFHVFRWYALSPAAAGHTIARLSDGSPAITECQAGLGTVVLFATSARTEWNNLAVASAGGLWLPLVNRTVGWMVQRQTAGLNVPVGQPLIFHPTPDLLNLTATVTRPRILLKDSVTIVPDARNLPTFFYGDTENAGEYDIDLAGETIKFAAQSDPRESILTPISGEATEKLKEVADIGPAGGTLRDRIDEGRIGTELWLPLTLLLLAGAVAETFLAHWFSRSK